MDQEDTSWTIDTWTPEKRVAAVFLRILEWCIDSENLGAEFAMEHSEDLLVEAGKTRREAADLLSAIVFGSRAAHTAAKLIGCAQMKISSGLITLCVASIFAIGCKDKAQPVQEPVAKTNESATGTTSVSTLSTFNKAITEFANKGGSERYEALLSERMKQKYIEAAAKSDDPEFKAEIAIRAKELNLPENSSMIEIAAAMWHNGLEPIADQMGTADIEVVTEGDRTHIHWIDIEVLGRALTITVTKENPGTPEESFKIDEN